MKVEDDLNYTVPQLFRRRISCRRSILNSEYIITGTKRSKFGVLIPNTRRLRCFKTHIRFRC